MKRRFPKDKDLAPGDIMAATSIPSTEPAGPLIEAMRQQYAAVADERGHLPSCDVILMAVPATKGQPFIDGLMESIANDEGGEVLR